MRDPGAEYRDLVERAELFLSLPAAPEIRARFNPNHGEDGRFSSGASKGVGRSGGGGERLDEPRRTANVEARATQFLILPDLPPLLHARHPGHGSQKVHAGGRGGGMGSESAMREAYDGMEDYAEHHADMSAQFKVDDVLNAKLKTLIAAREQV